MLLGGLRSCCCRSRSSPCRGVFVHVRSARFCLQLATRTPPRGLAPCSPDSQKRRLRGKTFGCSCVCYSKLWCRTCKECRNYDYCTNERVETIKTAATARGYALRAREGVRASKRLKILTYKYQFRAQCNCIVTADHCRIARSPTPLEVPLCLA